MQSIAMKYYKLTFKLFRPLGLVSEFFQHPVKVFVSQKMGVSIGQVIKEKLDKNNHAASMMKSNRLG